MTTRLLIAYALIAAIVLTGFVWLWFGLLRHRFRRRSYRRAERARRAALADRSA